MTHIGVAMQKDYGVANGIVLIIMKAILESTMPFSAIALHRKKN
jgi:preprotein translocase subunit SecY